MIRVTSIFSKMLGHHTSESHGMVLTQTDIAGTQSSPRAHSIGVSLLPFSKLCVARRLPSNVPKWKAHHIGVTGVKRFQHREAEP